MAVNARGPEAVARGLEAWAARRLPDHPGLRVAEACAPAGGASSETWLLRVNWDRGGARKAARWVLRIEARANQIYQDPSVERQFRTMQALARQTDVPVPQTLWMELDPAVLGAPFFLMEHVEGRTQPNRYHSSGVLFEASPAARERMWLSSIEVLARVHRADSADFAFLGYPKGGGDGVAQELARWDDYLDWAGLTHPVLTRGRRWLEDNRPATAGLGLAWGDARLGNVVFERGAAAALLDWETASLGGAETDLGWWIYYDRIIAEGSGVPRLEGVGGPMETIAAWESFSGRKARDMEWHEVFATWRFAMISERAVGLGIAAGRRPPGEAGEGNPAVRRLRELVG